MKRRGLVIIMIFVMILPSLIVTAAQNRLMSGRKSSESLLLSSVPSSGETRPLIMSVVDKTDEEKQSQLLSSTEAEKSSMMSGNSSHVDIEITYEYIYDMSLADTLDLEPDKDLSGGNDILSTYEFHSDMSEAGKTLNMTLASINMRYLEKTRIPLQCPLWLIALTSVEFNYTFNHPDLAFSFPVDWNAAGRDPSYLLSYDWNEMARIGGNSAVLARTGNALGLLQLPSDYGAGVEPVVAEEFGIIGAIGTRRSDAWTTLGDGTDTGDSIVWRHGVSGDRWSPADVANIVYAVYNQALRYTSLPSNRYEQAVLLMWAHNKGTAIFAHPDYFQMTTKLVGYMDEIMGLLEQMKPPRFTQSQSLMDIVYRIADDATGGEIYPVMSFISYLITESRYTGRW